VKEKRKTVLATKEEKRKERNEKTPEGSYKIFVYR
jgi:hypothetical protein